MSVIINPIVLPGPWRSGVALDLQTSSSTLIGVDQWGHNRFDTTRPPMGELLYKLKYRHDSTAVAEIVDTVSDFLRTWPQVDCIVPVPPSKQRTFQPLSAVAEALSAHTRIPLCRECISKVKATPELKDEADYSKKLEILNDAIAVHPELTQGGRILLLDDLYQTGATVVTITQKLMHEGGAKAVYLLTLTKSRR